MAGGFAALIGRVVFLCLVPLVSSLVGVESDPFVLLLSVLAAVAEFGLFACSPGGRKGRHSIRPARLFPLQVVLLYCMQLWLVMFHHVGLTAAPSPDAEPAAGGSHAAALAPAAPAPVPAVQPWTAPALAGAVGRGSAPAPPPADGGSSLPGAGAVVGGGAGSAEDFVLDAPLESLRWNPKTISVVLPCAEERDLAFKTVRSFFEMTPPEVLHEIVVVDDGSNPPLAATHLKQDIQKKYKVKICRHEDTVGLIGAKKTGGDAASGDIVAFFDCHVAPQKDWHKDFLRLIGQNYRRMVIPQITALDIETWKQIGDGGGMSKCYVTWDGDFKWGGPDDMYMGMLSGGLAGMSKRWWDESGGFDDQMLGWGGENIDQGVRMWVCGGEIVAAPNSQVAHMWRTGSAKTNARYKHVGDTMKNRARAIYAWYGEFAQKLDDFPEFHRRKQQGGDHWYGDMTTFQKVKDRLQGCRPFAWYLRRFKSIYEDGGIVPPEIFMIREEKSGRCMRFMGRAGTSGAGHEAVELKECNEDDPRLFWHLGNVDRRTGTCCSGLRAWNSEQCFQGGERNSKGATGICEVSGRNTIQHWSLHEDGQLRRRERCMGPGEKDHSLSEAPCLSFRSRGGARFTKVHAKVPIETELYQKAQRDHPETFKLLNEQLAEMAKANSFGPKICQKGSCVALMYVDESAAAGPMRCLDEEGALVADRAACAALLIDGGHVKRAESGDCLDTWSDSDPETWGFYGCHDGDNQHFNKEGPTRVCTGSAPRSCFASQPWPIKAR